MGEPNIDIGIDITDPTAVRQRLKAQIIELAAQAKEIERLKSALRKVTLILLKYFTKWGDTKTTTENLDIYPSEIAKAIVAAEQALKGETDGASKKSKRL